MKILVNGKRKDIREDTRLYELAAAFQGEYDSPIVLAEVDGKLRELFHRLSYDFPEKEEEIHRVSFVTVHDNVGYETMRRSLSMLFLAAVKRVYGDAAGRVILHFSFGSGFYYTIEGMDGVDQAFLENVTACMLEMARAGLRFEKRSIPIETAKRLFLKYGMTDKAMLFRTRLSSSVNVYSLGGYKDYYYGFMLYDTSLLVNFRLIPYHEGVVLQMPDIGQHIRIPEFVPSEKLFRAQLEGENWAETLGIGTVGDLNREVIDGDASKMILISEALQEAKISAIAGEIMRRGNIRFVMIAGPSSSGKTTFSQRLCIQLSAHGMKPHYIGTDNYFINREDMVPGPDGKLDFESLDAVDVKCFNRDMHALLAGETVEMPSFDFVTGKRVMSGEMMKLGPSDILVIEGLHSLNDALTHELPDIYKFKIYISALTQLNIDEHNRVPTGDGRLIRRIVRDNRTRGNNASSTINMWGSVRKGETENVFPFQESADVIFNSALPYELSVLKTYVQPLLFQVKKEDPGYVEARRLLKFLDYFVALPVTAVPMNSILREFVGGGCFRL